ncbi:MAG: BrnT family toxin [Phycisphaerae bacterium]|nr:BrnT family toxin [Phycisphaerae bacterium]
MDFRWDDWNVSHLARHGVRSDEAEGVVITARQPYPLHRADDKWLVWGPGRGGRLLQVVFVIDEDDSIYVIHARPLTDREKRRYRRRSRQ